MIQSYRGDIFEAPVDIIIHQTNCFNTMGTGIAKEIKKRYPRAAQVDRLTEKGDYKKLGLFTVAMPDAKQDRYIINLYGQFFYGRNKCYTDYKALKRGFENVRSWLESMEMIDAVVGIPFGIGCGNAGGDWKTVKEIIFDVFNKSKIQVLICQIN